MRVFVCLLRPVLHFFLTRARTFLFLHTPTMLSTTINTVNTHTHTGTAMGFHTTALRVLALLVVGTVGGIWLVSNFFIFFYTLTTYFSLVNAIRCCPNHLQDKLDRWVQRWDPLGLAQWLKSSAHATRATIGVGGGMKAESGERGKGEAVEVHEGGEGNNDLDMLKFSISCCRLSKFRPFSKM
jgi:hypothetical protein